MNSTIILVGVLIFRSVFLRSIRVGQTDRRDEEGRSPAAAGAVGGTFKLS